METQKPLLKDEDGEEVDVHLYRSMIGSLMYLTSSRPDIMFAVCACARYQVNPKISHLHAVKRILRYLKGQPKLVVANSITKAEYVAASSCCRDSALDSKLMPILERNGVNVGDSKLMLLGINLLLLGKVNAARHKLTAAREIISLLHSRNLLNDDPSSFLPSKELHFEEIKTIKSSIDDPPEIELKDLPSYLEYTFLEGTDKLPVTISKELKDKEKAALLKVLKSHKQTIAWKISDIKGIDPSFCTHKILMEDDFKEG
ncbi:hypothetical protein Tco_0770789 [Tanacetum coccineum]|uniref:Reverse transcriptase Ty1/copia-type domain-containing protein n=1 Tax=Tanacetum coccineum TaxID=301880 RepID=A0ABQ4ZD75_9ASTR